MSAPARPDAATRLRELLAGQPPFSGLPEDRRSELAEAAEIRAYASGELILDAFAEPSVEVFVVVTGQVDLWNDADQIGDLATDRLGPGGLFGFSAMLTERSLGPRVVAVDAATVAALPAALTEPAFASRSGVRFLAEQGAVVRRNRVPPSYSLVDELIVGKPLVVGPDDHVSDVARAMTEHDLSYAAVGLGGSGRSGGRFGLITDALLRRRILVDGWPGSTPARAVMETDVATASLGESAAEALITMLDADADYLLIVDRDTDLRGVVSAGHFTVAPTTAGVSVHEQIRRAGSTKELIQRARRVPAMLSDLLSRGLASGKVIVVYSAVVDTVVRRALGLIFAEHPELSVDAFTWMSLGSNGRRESVLSSDVDSAAAFATGTDPEVISAYRAVFAEVNQVLGRAGLSSDDHGASAERAPFSRTNQEWRAAARAWMAAPASNQGAIMTSLLVDGRPIHGDPGLPAVTRVFADLRRHPGTMRLLLQESLSTRARQRSVRDVFARREVFDVKQHALLPIVNLARWAGLSVGSAVLPTTERLRAAAGSAMLPESTALNLIEAFEMLQRLRLRYQLVQQQRGEPPSDALNRDRMSPIDRSMVSQAVREIAAAQRRMDNIAAYLPADDWSRPARP